MRKERDTGQLWRSSSKPELISTTAALQLQDAHIKPLGNLTGKRSQARYFIRLWTLIWQEFCVNLHVTCDKPVRGGEAMRHILQIPIRGFCGAHFWRSSLTMMPLSMSFQHTSYAVGYRLRCVAMSSWPCSAVQRSVQHFHVQADSRWDRTVWTWIH